MLKKDFKYGWTAVPNAIINNKNLSFKAKGLWIYINSKPDNWDFAIWRIAKDTKEGEVAIRAGLKELVKFGYLKYQPKYKNGKLAGQLYILKDVPENEDQKQRLVKTVVYKNSTLQNRGDYNNKELNNKVLSNTIIYDDSENKIESKNKENKGKEIKEINREKIEEFFKNEEEVKKLIKENVIPYPNQEWWEEQANATIKIIKEQMLEYYTEDRGSKTEIKNINTRLYKFLVNKKKSDFYRYVQDYQFTYTTQKEEWKPRREDPNGYTEVIYM
jgi:hypothetical protein